MASIFVLLVHGLLLYAITLKKESPTLIAQPVLEAVIIHLAATEPKKTVNIAPPKKPPTPPKPIVKKPIEKPKKIIVVEKQEVETRNTLTSSTPEASPEITPELEPVAEVATPAISEPVISLPRIDAKNKDNPPPTYPRIARKLGQEGVAILNIYILADGTVGEVALKKSSGYSRLDEAAITAAKSWHYVPAKRGNNNISFWYEHAVRFVLN